MIALEVWCPKFDIVCMVNTGLFIITWKKFQMKARFCYATFKKLMAVKWNIEKMKSYCIIVKDCGDSYIVRHVELYNLKDEYEGSGISFIKVCSNAKYFTSRELRLSLIWKVMCRVGLRWYFFLLLKKNHDDSSVWGKHVYFGLILTVIIKG